MSYLISTIFGIQIISLHSGLSLPCICKYSLGDGEQTLTVLAIGAVKLEGFIHGFFLSLNFDGDTFFIEFVL